MWTPPPPAGCPPVPRVVLFVMVTRAIVTFEVPLPAVITVKEGINLPRYASLPGRLRAKKLEIARVEPAWREGELRKQRLLVPQEQGSRVELLGEGPAAAARVVEVLKELGVA